MDDRPQTTEPERGQCDRCRAAAPGRVDQARSPRLVQYENRRWLAQSLPELPRLAWLDLRGTKISDTGLKRLVDLPSLKSLFLSGPKVTNTGLEHIGKIATLEHISLPLCRAVSNSGLLFLRGLYRLKRLDLRGTSVMEDGLNALQRYLPNCTILRD